jgi:hypothetical protein
MTSTNDPHKGWRSGKGAAMRNTLIGLAAAGCAVLGLAACSPAATDRPASSPLTAAPTGAPPPTPTPSAATDQFACTAIQLAAMGQWVQAESHWTSAASQEALSNLAAAMAFIRLAEDSGTIATDQTDGASSAVQATDTATYNSDLAGDRAFTAGC